ncbi:hypothetical protein M446_0983 [Methylobacterium sp. 4-46]|nr:hypothetical protein M446_0983 [Methylobacterium sp. 4-46]
MTSARRTTRHVPPPADPAPPGLLLDDAPQRLLRRFAGLSARARREREDELAPYLDRAALLAVALSARADPTPRNLGSRIPAETAPGRPAGLNRPCRMTWSQIQATGCSRAHLAEIAKRMAS